jgi:hypothetical protein
MATFKKITDLVEATGINPQDLFMIVDMVHNQSKKVTFSNLANALSFLIRTISRIFRILQEII